jgi:hypothetical protein
MKTWNELSQYQILWNILNFSKNPIGGLPREFINVCKVETIVSTLVANGLHIAATDLLKQDLINFLFAIPFAVDTIHMENLTRIRNDVTWIMNRAVQIHPFHTASGRNTPTTCNNFFTSRWIVFSNVCD